MDLFLLIIYICESSLFFYLISQQLTLRKKASRILIPGIAINVLFLAVINHICTDSLIYMSLSMILYLAMTFLITYGSCIKKFIIALLFPIITIFSKTIIYAVIRLFTIENSGTLLTESMLRTIMSTLYLLVLFLLVLLCARTKIKQLELPLGVHITVPILFFIAIVCSEIILFHILQYETYVVHINTNEKIVLICTLLSNLSIFICAVLLTSYLMKTYQKNIDLAEENRLQQLQQRQYYSILEKMKILRSWKHDFSQHLQTLHYFTTHQQLSEAAEYIQNLQKNIHQAIPISSTGNYIVDAVLSGKMFIINHHGIQFTYKVFLPAVLPLNDINLTALLGNIFDNAIESCLKLEQPENTYIKLFIQPHKDSLLIDLINSSDGNYNYGSGNILLSTKSDINHGIGLQHVIHIVESANGICRLTPEKDSFALHIILPLPQEEMPYEI